jgi:branched-chain amino acid transport system permease protein
MPASAAPISAIERPRAVDLFLQQLLAGIALGGVYALVALAVVMIYQASDHFNFAQGEMAMFSTYVAWSLIAAGLPYWLAFALTIAISFIGAVALQRVVLRPVEQAPVLNQVIVFIGLLVIFNALAGWLFDYTIKPFPSPFPERPLFGNRYIGSHELGVIGTTFVLLALVFAFLRLTPVGLAMRAAAQNPESARLVGIRVGWMLALGWGLAAAIGAVAGMMIAPIVFLEPNMMIGTLLYGFAGALLGGIDSPAGAVIGGFLVGVLENLIGTYVPFVGTDLKLTVALALIMLVLLLRPNGLFGRRVVRRV